jgi:hypothetical protein
VRDLTGRASHGTHTKIVRDRDSLAEPRIESSARKREREKLVRKGTGKERERKSNWKGREWKMRAQELEEEMKARGAKMPVVRAFRGTYLEKVMDV